MRQFALNATLKRPSELSAIERGAWDAFIDGNAALASPYFRLEFAECCEEARSDTRILIARKGMEIIGFLPMQMGKVGYARPLAGPLGDVQGAITPDSYTADIAAWLSAANVPLLEFQSALALQGCWSDVERWRDGSWIIDTSRGFDAFEAERTEAEPKAFRNIRARQRKLEAIDGGFEFRMMDDRPEILQTMLDWKRAQYRRTKVFDVFSVAWTRRLMRALLNKQTDRFSGLSSSLNIDGKIAAVHIGMASESRCHYWFPAYDPAFNKVSPGLLLLIEMIRRASDQGHDSVELGPGDYDFKRNLSSYQIPLSAGCVVTRSPAAALRSAARAMAGAAEKAPLGKAGTIPRRLLRRADKLSAFYAV
jgi:CelD/BcsL family acetyltransferase involved in cellulose biosynthesis